MRTNYQYALYDDVRFCVHCIHTVHTVNTVYMTTDKLLCAHDKGSFTYDVITLGGGRGFPNDDD